MMANQRGTLTPDAGWPALERALALAAERDLYVEAVALVDTLSFAMNRAHLIGQVTQVGRICERAENCVLELANENVHPTQQRGLLGDVTFLRALRAYVPAHVPISLGSTCCGQSDEDEWYPGGDYITIHLDRGDGGPRARPDGTTYQSPIRDPWDMVRRVWELANVSEMSGRPVVDDEGVGADERDDPGRRLASPANFFARGALARVLELGSTFHCQDCLYARVPGDVQRACAEAFIQGATLIPDEWILQRANARWSNSPVLDEGNTVRTYSGLADSHGALVALGFRGSEPGLRFRSGWRRSGVLASRIGADGKTVEVWSLAR